MLILPLFSLLFLISTPGLLWIFKRFELNLQKLEFWVLVTTGTAWVLSLIFYLLNPNEYMNPVWDAGFSLLPSLAFALDLIGSSYALAVTALVFFGVLVEKFSPQTSSWITPLAGVVLIILLADSAYTIALGWTVIEALFLFRFLRNQGELESSTRYILAVLFRLIAPMLLIYLSLKHSSTGTAPMLSELGPEGAFLMLAAGVIGFLGWFQMIGEVSSSSLKIGPVYFGNWLPASVGLLMISRAAGLASLVQDLSWGIDLAGGLISLLLVSSVIFLPSRRSIRLGSLALLFGGYLVQSSESALGLGTLFLLSGMVLLWEPESKKAALMKLILASVGLIPLPIFPAWIGLIQNGGLASYFLSAAFGLFFSKLIYDSYLNWMSIESSSEGITPLEMIGSGVILTSQVLIAARLGLFSTGLTLGMIPFSAWLAPLLMILGAALWIWLPGRVFIQSPHFIDKNKTAFTQIGTWTTSLIGEIVRLMTRLFEGDGGLIWTLLLAFLIFTLARVGGG